MDTIQKHLAYFEITSLKNKEILFSGCFDNFKSCLERAVSLKKDLSYADLSHQDLSHANLDGAILDHADFSYAKCNGVNLSEAWMTHARFLHTDLRDACFCESDLSHAHFMKSNMKFVDIAYAILQKTIFADPSALGLEFSAVETLKDCVYEDINKKHTTFSVAPTILMKEGQHICFFERHLSINTHIHGYDDMSAILMMKAPREKPKDVKR